MNLLFPNPLTIIRGSMTRQKLHLIAKNLGVRAGATKRKTIANLKKSGKVIEVRHTAGEA